MRKLNVLKLLILFGTSLSISSCACALRSFDFSSQKAVVPEWQDEDENNVAVLCHTEKLALTKKPQSPESFMYLGEVTNDIKNTYKFTNFLESYDDSFENIHNYETDWHMGIHWDSLSADYLKYTFFVKNVVPEKVYFTLKIEAEGMTKPEGQECGIEDILRVMIFEGRSGSYYTANYKNSVYAKDGEYIGESYDTNYGRSKAFVNNKTLAETSNSIKTDTETMYTVLFWLEYTDYDEKYVYSTTTEGVKFRVTIDEQVY